MNFPVHLTAELEAEYEPEVLDWDCRPGAQLDPGGSIWTGRPTVHQSWELPVVAAY